MSSILLNPPPPFSLPPMSKRTETVASKVAPETKRALLRVCKRESRTESWLANQYIKEGIARDRKKK